MSDYECISQSQKDEVSAANERNKLNLHELSEKEEEIVVLRVELSSMQEKFAAKKDQVRSFKCLMNFTSQKTYLSHIV